MVPLSWSQWNKMDHALVLRSTPCLGDQWQEWDENCRVYPPFPKGFVSTAEEAVVDIARCLLDVRDFLDTQLAVGALEDAPPGTFAFVVDGYLAACLTLVHPRCRPMTPRLYVRVRELLTNIVRRLSEP